MWVFSNFSYGFRSSCSTADPLTVLSVANHAVALEIFKTFARVWFVVPLCNLKSYEISVWLFGLISYFLSNRRFQVVLNGKSLQEYPVNIDDASGFFFDPILFQLYTLMTFLMLSLYLLCMLMILLCTVSLVRHLIFGNN